jgi:hypothetical protein
LSRCCDFINEQYMRIVINANVFEWKKLRKIFCKDYKNKDLNQQLHSLKYIEVFKDKMRTFLNEISQYCLQYIVIFEKLIKAEKLQRTFRSVWFFQRLFEIDWSQNWISDMSNSPIRSNPRVEQKFLSDESGRVLAIVRRSNPTREIVRNLRLDKIR